MRSVHHSPRVSDKKSHPAGSNRPCLQQTVNARSNVNAQKALSTLTRCSRERAWKAHKPFEGVLWLRLDVDFRRRLQLVILYIYISSCFNL